MARNSQKKDQPPHPLLALKTWGPRHLRALQGVPRPPGAVQGVIACVWPVAVVSKIGGVHQHLGSPPLLVG